MNRFIEAKRQHISEQDAELLVQDLMAEEAVLGAIMQDNSVLNEYREQLSPSCFYQPQHAEIFNAVYAIVERGNTADLLSVTEELRRTGSEITPYEITQIYGKGVRLDVAEQISYLKDLALGRQIWHIFKKYEHIGTSYQVDRESLLEEARTALNDVYSLGKKNIFTLEDAISELYEQVNSNASENGALTGSFTGFDFLDKKGGLQGGNLVIIAGATSQGKTSFANSISLNAIKTGKKVAFYSMEMSKKEIASRIVSSASRISSSKLLYSPLTEGEFMLMDRGVGSLNDCMKNLFFDDRSISNVDAILSSIRSMKIKHGIDGAIIDYLQILNVNMKNQNKEQAMADVARRLKNLAKELDIWIIALSQLNRDSQDPVPSINRLRDSGQIAEAADVVMLVYRPEYYGKPFPQPFTQYGTQGKAMIDVCKGRNIGVGKFICGFNAETTHFYQLDQSQLTTTDTTSDLMPWE